MADQQLDIIFAMPHPDDLEISCGGTIAKMVKLGHKVGMLHLTNGEPTPLGTVEKRVKEAERAAEILGVQHMEILPLTNRELMDTPENRYQIATVFRRFRPKIVVGMAGRTPGASPDHYQSQLLIEASRFYSQLTKWDERFDNTEPHRIPWLWYRPIIGASEIHHYHANFIVDVSDTHEQKMKAIACYETQFPPERFARLQHRVTAWDAAEGGRSGFDYGERFALPQPMPMVDPVAHFRDLKVPLGPPALVPKQGEVSEH